MINKMVEPIHLSSIINEILFWELNQPYLSGGAKWNKIMSSIWHRLYDLSAMTGTNQPTSEWSAWLLLFFTIQWQCTMHFFKNNAIDAILHLNGTSIVGSQERQCKKPSWFSPFLPDFFFFFLNPFPFFLIVPFFWILLAMIWLTLLPLPPASYCTHMHTYNRSYSHIFNVHWLKTNVKVFLLFKFCTGTWVKVSTGRPALFIWRNFCAYHTLPHDWRLVCAVFARSQQIKLNHFNVNLWEKRNEILYAI